MSDALQLTHLLHLAQQALDVLTTPIQWAMDPVQLAQDVAALVGAIDHAIDMCQHPPPGEPAALRALADEFHRLHKQSMDIAGSLNAVSGTQLPDGMVGVAAGTASDAIDALALVAENAATGHQRTADGLEQYAGVLTAAQGVHASGAADLARAAERARGAFDVHEVFGVPTPIPDVEATVSALSAAAAMAVSGAEQCFDSYRRAVDGLYGLRRDLSDARGNAVLADRGALPGWTVLDTVVLSAAGTGLDPDDGVLDDAAWHALGQTLATMPTAERERLVALLRQAAGPLERATLAEAIARGHGPEQVAMLARKMRENPLLAEELQDLSTRSSEDFVQLTGTTCGSTTLVRQLTRHDPLLSLWLLTGERPTGYNPAFLAGMTQQEWNAPSFAERLGLAQEHMQNTTNGFHWPDAAGTFPADVPRVLNDMADLTGRQYDGHWVDDQDHEMLRERLTQAAEAVNEGAPVPIYVGGDADLLDPSTYDEGIPATWC